MSDALGFNKIAGCVLATGLALLGLNQASAALFRAPKHDKDGYHIEVAETSTGGPAVVEGPRDYFKLISAANPEAGKEVSKKCEQCHDLTTTMKTVTGPPLYGLVGRPVASISGFKYTTGKGSITEIGGEWGYEKLDHYLERPKAMAPATAMNFFGLKKPADRINLLAFLRTNTSGEQLALPPPLPDAPAAPADGAAAPGATPGAAPGPAPGPAPGNGAAPAAVAPASGAAPAPGSAAPGAVAPATPAPAKPGAAGPAKPAAPAPTKPVTPAQPGQH
jgi:cytochrome c